VLGPVDSSSLGVTISHEHALIDLRCLFEPPRHPTRLYLADAPVTRELRRALEDEPYQSRDNLVLDDEEVAAGELIAFRDAGGRTLIDLTVEGLGPRPEALRRLSHRTGLHIVAGCGIYRAIAHADWVRAASFAGLRDRFVGWAKEGLPGTSIRPGLFGEIGTSSPIHEDELKVLRATGQAQLATGLSINVHAALWQREGNRILDILEEEGVQPERVAISHLDELLDFDYHRTLAQRGAWLGYDTFGSEFRFGDEREPTDAERIHHLQRMLDAGWAEQILLSQDVCNKLHLRHFGGRGYAHLLTDIVPKLREGGVDERTIYRLLVTNPARFLSGG
jgi:phosphotriesterase-related protein